jgi:hypothetical protein
VDTLEQRLSKSSAWLKSVGASINWLQEDVDDRVSEISRDGGYNVSHDVIMDNKTLTAIFPIDAALDGAGPNTVNECRITSATTNIIVADVISAGFTKNVVFQWNGVYYRVVETPIQGVDAKTISFMTDVPVPPLGANSDIKDHPEFALYATKYSTKYPRRVTGFEIIWRPLCLSIFKHQGALPLGKYQLIATPHNASGNNYKIRAIETPHNTPTPTFGTGANDINFKVKDLRMYICNVTGPRVEDKSFFIDLEETRCQKALLKNTTNLSSEPFEIEPSSYALTYCLQDVNAGIDPKYSSSRFRERDGKELSLNRLFISLGRNNYPSPDAEPSYKEGNADDYTTKCYVDTAINCGGYFSEGGFSSLDEWQRYGAIHYFQTPRDTQDRSTRAVVNTKFAENFDNQANHVLFSHYRKAVQVTIQRGTVISVKEYVM